MAISRRSSSAFLTKEIGSIRDRVLSYPIPFSKVKQLSKWVFHCVFPSFKRQIVSSLRRSAFFLPGFANCFLSHQVISDQSPGGS